MADASAPTLESYLEKQRVDKKKSKWTKRWFVLRGNQLSYFETNKSKQAKATHLLSEGGTVTCHFDKLQFEVVTDGYARNFRASNFHTFRDWVSFSILAYPLFVLAPSCCVGVSTNSEML